MTWFWVAAVVLGGALFVAGSAWAVVDHHRRVAAAVRYLREHEGADRERDRAAWSTIHEGQG